jgi:hypothetical protein
VFSRLGLVLGALSATALTAQQSVPATPIRIQDSVILLPNGQRWEPGLYDMKYLYTLQAPGGTPFYVLWGIGCTDCDAEYWIYILRPGQVIDSKTALIGFTFPGRDYRMGSDSANAFRRQFFGHCLKDAPSVAVQFAHEQADDSVWVDSIRTVAPTRDSLRVRDYAYTKVMAREVLDLALVRQCHGWEPAPERPN